MIKRLKRKLTAWMRPTDLMRRIEKLDAKLVAAKRDVETLETKWREMFV